MECCCGKAYDKQMTSSVLLPLGCLMSPLCVDPLDAGPGGSKCKVKCTCPKRKPLTEVDTIYISTTSIFSLFRCSFLSPTNLIASHLSLFVLESQYNHLTNQRRRQPTIHETLTEGTNHSSRNLKATAVPSTGVQSLISLATISI
jgi:hypothetical protein